MPETAKIHGFNPTALRHTKFFGDAERMTQMGIHLVSVLGKEITEFHFHSQ